MLSIPMKGGPEDGKVMKHHDAALQDELDICFVHGHIYILKEDTWVYEGEIGSLDNGDVNYLYTTLKVMGEKNVTFWYGPKKFATNITNPDDPVWSLTKEFASIHIETLIQIRQKLLDPEPIKDMFGPNK